MQHIPGLQEFKKQQFMQDAAAPFGPFYDDPSTSDIVVMAGEAKIHAHKMFLSKHSSLFKALFAQKLLAGIMKHTASKQAALENA